MKIDPNNKNHKINVIIEKAKKFLPPLQRGQESTNKEFGLEKESFKFKACDILKTLDGRLAVEIALDCNDEDALKKMLHVEKHCHPRSSRDAIRCFRKVIETDERSVKAVKLLDEQYDPSWAAKWIVPIFSVFPLALRLVSIIYDEVSDLSLAKNYHEEAMNLSRSTITTVDTRSCFTNGNLNFNNTYDTDSNKTLHERTASLQERLTLEDYIFAKYYIIFAVVGMLLLNGPLTFKRIKQYEGGKTSANKHWVLIWMKWLLLVLISPILSPVMIFILISKMIIAKWKFTTAKTNDEKMKYMKKFWNHQIEFGMYETIEAAEATVQLMLQLWFLGSNYDRYYQIGFLPLFKEAVNGSLFVFLPNTTIEEKSLGKFFVSFVSICISAYSMYRRTKKQAVHVMSGTLLVISILSQIIVHISCVFPLYYVERNWRSLVFPILMHFILVAAVKSVFDPGFRMAKGSRKTIWVLNIVGSTILNVNLIPPEGYKLATTKTDKAVKGMDELGQDDYETHALHKGLASNKKKKLVNSMTALEKEDETHHNPSTFVVQTIYFFVKFIEYLTILLLVMVYCEIDSDKVFETFRWKLSVTLVCGSVISWLSHIGYYRLYGHPWSFSNGPTINLSTERNQNSLNLEFFLLGRRKKITMGNSNQI